MNFDELFKKKTRIEPIIINDFQEHSEKARKEFNQQIYTRYQPTDVLSNVPTCIGGHIVGEFHRDITCPICNTVVESPMDQELQSLIWLRAPKKVEKLINPMIWTMLSNHFKKGKFNVIQWLCDTLYPTPAKPPKILAQVQALGIPRGYNNFVKNFDSIITKLLTIRDFRKEKRRSRLDSPLEKIQQILIENRDCVFSDHLPLPNKTLLVVEDTSLSTFVDPIVTGAIDAILSMIGMDDALMNHSLAVRQNRVVRAIAQLAMFYRDFYGNSLAAKEGIARKHLYGTRCYFSFRSVISSLTGPHHREELHVPWGVGIGLLRMHLIAKLYKMDYTPNAAVEFLNDYAQRYHPVLDALFMELIAESPWMGLPVIFQRNPSLERGSMQRCFITRIKTDVDDPTVSMSILTVRGYNADFDGDEMNGTLLIDNWAAEQVEPLAPHKSTLDMSEPRKISGNLAKPKPVMATFAAWLEAAGDEPPDPVKLRRMDLIPDAA